jgi:hypothetical protein
VAFPRRQCFANGLIAYQERSIQPFWKMYQAGRYSLSFVLGVWLDGNHLCASECLGSSWRFHCGCPQALQGQFQNLKRGCLNESMLILLCWKLSSLALFDNPSILGGRRGLVKQSKACSSTAYTRSWRVLPCVTERLPLLCV